MIWAHGVQAHELHISAFSQLDGETFSQAWFRFSDLLLGCPQHRFETFRLIQIFYDGLRVDAHAFVEEMSGGTFSDMTAEDAWRFLVDLADQDRAWPPTVSVPDFDGGQCQGSVDTSVQQLLDQVAALQAQSLQFQQVLDAQMTEGSHIHHYPAVVRDSF